MFAAQTVYTKETNGLDENQAYGSIQLTGASAVPNGNPNNYNSARKRDNTYITAEQDPNDFTISGVGPAYETIEDAKKAAKKASSTAANPIYASGMTGSQLHLADNPVYSETFKPPVNGTEERKCYMDMSALNPVYSGLGLPPQGAGSGGPPPRLPTNFPYQAVSPPPTLSPPVSASQNEAFVYSDIPPSASIAVPLPQQTVVSNHSQSTENQVEPSLNPLYEEIVQERGTRVRTAVSLSSDHEQPGFPLGKNTSYGLLTDSPTAPLLPPTSPLSLATASSQLPPAGEGPLPTSPPPPLSSQPSSKNATLV